MAISINTSGTYTITRISACESLTGFTSVKLEGAGGTPALFLSVGNIDLVREGSDAVGCVTNKTRILVYFSIAAGYDFTTGSTGTGSTKVPDGIVYAWAAFLAAGSAFTKANGGGQIMLGDGTNRSYWNVFGSDTYTGGFDKWAVFTGISPSETSGTAADLGDITEVGFVTDVGTTTTRFDNFVLDAMDTGTGLTFQGTTTTDKLFSESVAQDEVTAIGAIKEENGVVFCQGSVEFSGTAQTSDSETFIFIDTVSAITSTGYTYQFDITGTVTFQNSSINAVGKVDYNFDTSGATAFTMNGGSASNYLALTTGAGQTISGVVFQAGGAGTIANTISASTFNQCGLKTISGAGVLDGCTFNDTSDANYAVSVANLNDIPNCIFRDSTVSTHCCILTGAAGSYTWSGLDPDGDYDIGTASGASTDVAVTGVSITGNEHIYINDANGANEYSITVATGAITPSVATAGAIVYVIANQRTVSFTVNPAITGYEWRFYSITALGSLAGAAELVTGEESATASTQSDFYNYTYAINQYVCLQVISDAYKESLTYFTLPDQNTNLTIDLEIDNND